MKIRVLPLLVALLLGGAARAAQYGEIAAVVGFNAQGNEFLVYVESFAPPRSCLLYGEGPEPRSFVEEECLELAPRYQHRGRFARIPFPPGFEGAQPLDYTTNDDGTSHVWIENVRTDCMAPGSAVACGIFEYTLYRYRGKASNLKRARCVALQRGHPAGFDANEDPDNPWMVLPPGPYRLPPRGPARNQPALQRFRPPDCPMPGLRAGG